MDVLFGLLIFIAGCCLGSTIQWWFNARGKADYAGRIMVSRDEDGVYLHAGIENLECLHAGNVVEFEVWEVSQNE